MVEPYIMSGDLIELKIIDYKLPPLVYYLIHKKGHTLSNLIKNNHKNKS